MKRATDGHPHISPPPGGGWRVSGRGRARNEKVCFCFGYHPPNLGCDNNMNFPTLQNLYRLAGSLRRSRASSLPEGA